MLQIRTLGGLSVLEGARPVSGSAQQPRRLAILALLARAGARGVSRDRLLLLLWPDADEERGRRGLNQALYALRQDLGGEDAILGAKELRLNPEIIESDVQRFLEARSSGRPAEAAAMWGGPFLDGFNLSGVPDFERWVEEERAALSHMYAETLEGLAQAADAKGDAPGAVTWWRRLAAQDPLNARVAEALVRSLVKAGDAPGALRHIEVHASLRQEELALGPEPALVRLSERIRKGELAAPLRDTAQHPVVQEEASPFSEPVMEQADAEGISTGAGSVVEAPGAPTAGWHRWVIGAAALAVVGALWLGVLPRRPQGATHATHGPLMAVGSIQDFTGDSAGRAAPLSEMLATNLARVSGLTVVSTSRLYEVLQQVATSEGSPAAQMAQAARRAGAAELVEGALYRAGSGRYRLDLRRIELEHGQVLGALSVEGVDLFALADSGTVLLAQTLRGLAPEGGLASVTTQSEAAYRYYDAGLRAKARGDLGVAREMFAAALRDDSLFAMAAFQAGRIDPDGRRAIALTRQAMRLSDRLGDRDRLTIRAGWGFLVSDPSFLAVSETLAIRFPGEVTGHYWRAQALTRDRRYAEAIPVFERVIALDSLGLTVGQGECVACDAFDGLRYALVALDSLDAADRVLRRWLAATPNSIRAHLLQCENHNLRRDGAAATRSLDLAERNGLTGRELALRRWSVALAMEDFRASDSIMATVRGTGTPEQQADARFQHAMALRAEGRFGEAVAALREARALVRRNAPASGLIRVHLLHESQALMEGGRWREAIAVLDTVTHINDPLEPPIGGTRSTILALALAARAHAQLGDTASLGLIADSLEALVAGDPGLARSRVQSGFARAMYLAATGRRDDAIARLEALRYSPTVGFVLVEVALAEQLLAAGRAPEAAAVIRPTLRGYRDGGGLFATAPALRALLARAERGGAPVAGPAGT